MRPQVIVYSETKRTEKISLKKQIDTSTDTFGTVAPSQAMDVTKKQISNSSNHVLLSSQYLLLPLTPPFNPDAEKLLIWCHIPPKPWSPTLL